MDQYLMMEIEENRMSTFTNWPSDAPIEAARIAKGGFYATGNEMEVQCHWCNNKISDWHYGDQVMARHRRMNPLCPFVVNPVTSGNIPVTNHPETVQLSEVGPIDLMNEQCRLSTFRNWPISYVTPQSLAKAGFYYYNQSDCVSCAWCHGVIAKWEVGDNPFTEHQRFFPNCPRAQLGPNIEIASDGIRDLGIQRIRAPKVEKFSCLDARIRTFSRWPRSDIQNPEVLATAGFYFQDIDDEVRCFHCHGGLRSWQKEDDPWFEHAKWFPKCQFVQLVKGDQYIRSVQQLTRPSLDDAMQSQYVQQALQMGLHEGRIRAATKKHLDKFGKPHTCVEALVEAVLDSQHEEEDDDSENQSSTTIVREVSRILDTIFNPRASTSSYDTNENNVQDIDHQHQQRSSNSKELASNVVLQNANADATTNNAYKNAAEQVPESSETYSNDNQLARSNSVVAADNFQQLSLEEENRKLKDARLCKICMADEVGVVFLPCGHLVTCVQCAPGVSACPLCRSSIKAFVRTFLS